MKFGFPQWLFRLFIIAMSVPYLTACLQSERPLLKNEGLSPPKLEQGFIKSCSLQDSYCVNYWIGRYLDMQLGGTLDEGFDMRLGTFLPLDDARHWIAQIVQVGNDGTSYYQYGLMRPTARGYRYFSADLERMNPAYVAYLEQSSYISTVDKNSLVKLTDWNVSSREGLVKIFTDLSKLDDATLAQMGDTFDIEQSSPKETALALQAVTKRRAELDIELAEYPAASINTSLPRINRRPGCPVSLPDKVTCRVFTKKPLNPIPSFGKPEVMIFDKYGCKPCRRIQATVAQWRLANASNWVFQRTSVIDWSEHATTIYGVVDRVPAFVVNRKYLVGLETSETSAVQYALALVEKLAAEMPQGVK